MNTNLKDTQQEILQTSFTLSTGGQFRPKLTDLMAEGGEGSIWRGPKGSCIKIFHLWTDKLLTHKAHKLLELSTLKIDGAITPMALVEHPQHGVCGYQMPKVEGTSVAQMTSVHWQHQNGWGPKHVIDFIEQMRLLLVRAHAAGIVVGDLNEFNWMHSQKGEAILIDCDSWGIGSHKVSAQMSQVADPLQKGTSQQTDWYAFALLATYLFVGARAYSGTHPVHGRANAADRQKQGASLFDPGVRLAGTTRNPQDLPAHWAQWFSEVLSHRVRSAMPALQSQVQPTTASNLGNTVPKAASLAPQYLGSGILIQHRTVHDLWGKNATLTVQPMGVFAHAQLRYAWCKDALGAWSIISLDSTQSTMPLPALLGAQLIDLQGPDAVFMLGSQVLHYRMVFLRTPTLTLVSARPLTNEQMVLGALSGSQFGAIMLSGLDRVHRRLMSTLIKTPGPGWYVQRAHLASGVWSVSWGHKTQGALHQVIVSSRPPVATPSPLAPVASSPAGTAFWFSPEGLYQGPSSTGAPFIATPTQPITLWYEHGCGRWMYHDFMHIYQEQGGKFVEYLP